jgi:predicted nucleotidyltransferase
MSTIAAIPIPHEKVAAFCQRWGVVKLELFGSVLREDFDPARSDVDVMVTFAPGRLPGWEFFADFPEELSAIIGHKVDAQTRRGVETMSNSLRRRHILENSQVIYER